MLPNHRLLALTFRSTRSTTPSPTHRSSPSLFPQNHKTKSFTTSPSKSLSGTTLRKKWQGRQPDDHAARETDTHNVQHDAAKAGKAERAKGEGGAERATSEGAGGSNERAKEEFPEAPDTIGMQDERGGKKD